MPDHQLTAAERYAGLIALRDALDHEVKRAKAACETEAAALRSASWNTPYGAVTASRSKPSVALDEDAFVEYVRANHPDEVEAVTTYHVNPAFRQAITGCLTIVAGNVVDTRTGEVIPWAHVVPEGSLRIAYPASREQRDAKAFARMLLEDRVDELTSGLRAVTA